MTLALDRVTAQIARGTPVALVAAPGRTGLAWRGGSLTMATDPAEVVAELAPLDPR